MSRAERVGKTDAWRDWCGEESGYPRCHGSDLVCDSCQLTVNRWFLWCMCTHIFTSMSLHTHTNTHYQRSKLDGPIRYGCHSAADKRKNNMGRGFSYYCHIILSHSFPLFSTLVQFYALLSTWKLANNCKYSSHRRIFFNLKQLMELDSNLQSLNMYICKYQIIYCMEGQQMPECKHNTVLLYFCHILIMPCLPRRNVALLLTIGGELQLGLAKS